MPQNVPQKAVCQKVNLRRSWPALFSLSWCDQKETGLCDQKENNALCLLPWGICSVISSVKQYTSMRRSCQEHRPDRWLPSKSLRELCPARALYQVDW